MPRTHLRSSDAQRLHTLFAKDALGEPLSTAEIQLLRRLVDKRRRLAMNDPQVRSEIEASRRRVAATRRLMVKLMALSNEAQSDPIPASDAG